MEIFRRNSFSQIWVNLKSDEVLGVLDSSYIQDYFGNQGQITLYHPESGVRIPIAMNELIGPDDPTPEIPHDVFTGFIDLSTIQDGTYRIEGLVRDTVGNYTVLSEIQNPLGIERVIGFDLRITDAEIIVSFPQAAISLGIMFSTHISTIPFNLECKLDEIKQFSSNINKISVLPLDIVYSTLLQSGISKGVILHPLINETISFDASIGYG
jgi:hypothetical protein